MSTQKWSLDLAHSELQFKVRHMMISNVTGNFNDFKVEVNTPGAELEHANIVFSALVDSVSTGNVQRDKHLKSGDFFDVSQYPELRFVSTSFTKSNEEGVYELQGDLTIRGVTKPVNLRVEHGGVVQDPFGNTKAGFSLSGKIKRSDWGLDYNAALEAGGVVVSDEVRILADLQLAAVN